MNLTNKAGSVDGCLVSWIGPNLSSINSKLLGVIVVCNASITRYGLQICFRSNTKRQLCILNYWNTGSIRNFKDKSIIFQWSGKPPWYMQEMKRRIQLWDWLPTNNLSNNSIFFVEREINLIWKSVEWLSPWNTDIMTASSKI